MVLFRARERERKQPKLNEHHSKSPIPGNSPGIACNGRPESGCEPGRSGSPHMLFHIPVLDRAQFCGPAWHRVYSGYIKYCGGTLSIVHVGGGFPGIEGRLDFMATGTEGRGGGAHHGVIGHAE